MPETVGRYELGDRVASDAMSRTHRAGAGAEAVHVRIAQLPDLPEEMRAQFEKDAVAAAALSHENILPMLDHGLHGGLPYIVVPPVETKTLREVMAAEPGRRLPPEIVASIGADIASALAHAHAVPVVHRALSPDAIVLGADGVARIASFALPALFVAAASAHSHLLEHTCRYSSPEQAKNGRTSSASDVFALGATLYEALAGKPAFDAPTPLATVLKVTMGVHVSLDIAAPTTPPPLRQTIGRMLAKNEADRPSAADVHAVLEEIAGRDRSRRAAVGKRVGPAAASSAARPSAPSPSSTPTASTASAPRPSAPTPAPAAVSAPQPAPPRAPAPPPRSDFDDDPATQVLPDIPPEPTRVETPVGPAPVPPPVSGAGPMRAAHAPPPPVRQPAPSFDDDADVADLPGEATTWDTQLPDVPPVDATAPEISLPFDRDDDAPRPLVVEKTVQIAMPAATAAMFDVGRPTMPVAPPSIRTDERKATRPVEPEAIPAPGAPDTNVRRVQLGGDSALVFVAIGVGAIAAVALAAVLAVWLAG